MEADTKQKLEDFIKETAKGSVMEAFAEFRKEQEAKAKEERESLALQFAEATKKAADEQKEAKGLGAARIARAWAAARGDVQRASEFAKKYGAPDEVVKALATAPNSAGGYVIPPSYSSDIIELLYNRVAVRQLGATLMPMPNGTLAIPKLVSGITAQYIGENTGDNSQQPAFGVITASWKKLRATVPISNDLLLFSDPKVDAVVRDDLVSSFAVAEDAAFLFGAGSGTSPKGIYRWLVDDLSANILAAQSADGSDLTLVIADLFKLPRQLEQANIPMVKPGWVMNPRVKYFLMQLRDSVGNFYFLDEMRRGTLLGIPFVSTNQVPDTGLPSTNETAIILGDWPDAVIAESSDLTLDSSTEASYLVAGTLVSAFANDQTLLRGIARHDFIPRRLQSFAALNDITWGV